MGEKFNANNLPQRLFWFCLGLLINSFGIALITKAGLGTSQISSIPYVLSFEFDGLSFAMGTFLVNVVFILVQIALLGRSFFPAQLLQLPVNIVFSSFLGVAMSVLGWVAPTTAPGQLAVLLLGCCVLGCGIAIECAPNLIFVPGEGIVYAIAQVTHKKLGSTKVVFDVCLVVSSFSLSMLLFGSLRGVGIGTIVCACFTGFVVNFANARFGFLANVRELAAQNN